MAAGVVAKLACDARVLRTLDEVDEDAPAVGFVASARLLKGPLWRVFALRGIFGVSGGMLLPMAARMDGAPGWLPWLAMALLAAGELVERYLFFRAVDAPKMPGVVT